MQDYGFLGGDVSKGMCDFVLYNVMGQELEMGFQLDDNRQGHRGLYKALEKLKKKHGLKKIVVGLESTGGYENNWYRGLRSQSEKLGLEVFRINPKRIFHEGKTEGVRSISDGVSARIIAGYLRKNYGQKDLEKKRLRPTTDSFGMRSLHKYIQRLIKQRTQTINALEKLLYSFLPEVLSAKGEKYSNWFLELLITYPSIESMLSAGVEGLTRIKYLSTSKANKILKGLTGSVGDSANDYIKISISEQAEDIQNLTKKIDRLKKEMQILAEPQIKKEIDIVSSISGIGVDTAIPIIIEIDDISRFEKASSLVAFWGINPTIKQSGDKQYYCGMSKDGSPAARAVMYMAAKNVAMHEPYFKAIYSKQRAKGKTHLDALGVVMSKLTRVIYGMLRSGKAFDAGTDIYNQEKKPDNTSPETKKTKDTKRRYQKQLSAAPVSSRQRKKRKQEQNVSS